MTQGTHLSEMSLFGGQGLCEHVCVHVCVPLEGEGRNLLNLGLVPLFPNPGIR